MSVKNRVRFCKIEIRTSCCHILQSPQLILPLIRQIKNIATNFLPFSFHPILKSLLFSRLSLPLFFPASLPSFFWVAQSAPTNLIRYIVYLCALYIVVVIISHRKISKCQDWATIVSLRSLLCLLWTFCVNREQRKLFPFWMMITDKTKCLHPGS